MNTPEIKMSHFHHNNPFLDNVFFSLGERSVQLDVLKYLIKVVKNEVVNSNRVVSNVVYGTVYNLITSLLDAFDPECMGLGRKKIFVFHISRHQTLEKYFLICQFVDMICH